MPIGGLICLSARSGDYHWEGGIGIGLERDVRDGQSVDDSVDSGEGIVCASNIKYL